MAQLPGGNVTDVFTSWLDGTYGRFKTSQSFALDYVQTSLRMNELEKLVTAAEAFDFKKITFEELVQRDIDYDRVDNEIVKEYLEAGKERVVFFPPLLVSLVAIEDGAPVEEYDEVVTNVKDGVLTRIWGGDKFKLELNVTDVSTGHIINDGDKSYNFINYAATIKYNKESVKLVVLDGQHRFKALERVMSGPDKDLLKDAEVPVCLFFTPGAVKGAQTGEINSKNLRELFVTINMKAREVGGHFLDLLNDKSLASHSVRLLADEWKKPDENGVSILPLLEWNTRAKGKAHQRTKEWSITTVSILASALRNYVFSAGKNDVGGWTETLLNLKEVRSDLEEFEEAVSYDSISEETFGIKQISILKKRIGDFVVPSLTTLLTAPTPYAELCNKFQSAVENIDQQIQRKTPGVSQYKKDVLYQFRRCTKNDQDAVKDAETQFESMLDIPDEHYPYFSNVFQQALIRAWADLSGKLVRKFALSPVSVAQALVPSLECICFSISKKLFDSSRAYTQQVLYRGAKYVVNETARTQWVNLILATFKNDGVREIFVNKVKELKGSLTDKEISEIDEITKLTGKISAEEYLEILYSHTRYDIHKNWQYKEYDQSVKTFLLQRRDSDDESMQSEYEERIDELTKEKLDEAKESLANILEIETKLLHL